MSNLYDRRPISDRVKTDAAWNLSGAVFGGVAGPAALSFNGAKISVVWTISESAPVFLLLIAGSLVSAGYRPFMMILNQTGFPGYQSLLFILIFLTNAAGNFLLVPRYGMIGAAIGTSVSFVASVFYLKWLLRKTNGIKI